MDSDKKTPPEEPKDEAPKEDQVSQQAPADALSLTPEELEKEESANGQEHVDLDKLAEEEAQKHQSPFKRLLKKVNVYFLGFILLVAVAGAVAVVSYINDKKVAPAPSIASQNLTPEALKQLANTDVSVGSSTQTLTIKGNTIISGQTLMKGNLSVAGNLQTGGSLEVPNLTISGTSNLASAQVNTLQVATSLAVQGTSTLQNMNVSGTANFSGPLTASQITVTKLTLTGNASLQVPNHIGFPGATPTRTVDNHVLGAGGSASVSGSDTAGTININTGSGTSAGCFLTMKFNVPFTSQPRVNITPVGAGAGLTQYYVTRTTTSFSVCTNNAPPNNQVFAYDYFITN